MSKPYFSIPVRATLMTILLLATFMLLAADVNPTIYASNAAQTEEPPVSPPDEDPEANEGRPPPPVVTQQQQRATALTTVGGPWAAQGPGPATDGQVENIPNMEVVGAVHVLAAHPTNADILYAGEQMAASGRRLMLPAPAQIGYLKRMTRPPYPLVPWNLTLPTAALTP